MFSVIIPTYKTSAKMLIRSIESVKMQIEKDYEIIVVDDNPKGSSWKREILALSKEKEYNKINWISHNDNMGAAEARNTGIKFARGEIVAFLDSDDEWDPYYLEEVKKCYDSPNTIITACDVVRIFPDRISMEYKKYDDGFIYGKLLYEDIVGATSSVTVKTEYISRAGLFDISLPARQDYDMWIRVCKLGNIKYIHKPLVKLYCDDHMRISRNIENHEQGTLKVLKKILSENEYPGRKKEIEFSHKSYLAKKWLLECENKKAREYYRECAKIKITPQIIMGYILSYSPFVTQTCRKFMQQRNDRKARETIERFKSASHF